MAITISSNSTMVPDNFKQLPIAAPPQTQVLSSKTFQAPPLDGSLTVPEIYDWHAEHSPEHPLFLYGDPEGPVHTITWAEAVRAIHRAGRIVQNAVGPVASPTVPVIAILANTEPITFFTVAVGIMRAGFAVFAISPRNSPAAVAHLLQKTSPVHLIVGPEPNLKELAAASYNILKGDGAEPPRVSEMPFFDALYGNALSPFEPLPPVKRGADDIVLIMHSSGSTAFPKPIAWSNYRFTQLALTPYFGEQDLCGRKLSFHAATMYHAMGMMQTAWTASTGLVLACLKPVSPSHSMTPELLIRAATHSHSDFLFCVPSFVEAYAKNPEHVELLQNMRGVIFGGGPLAKEVGDQLTDQGVTIYLLYGMSEAGIVAPFLPNPKGKDWEYFSFPDNIKTHLIPVEDGTENVELVVVPSAWEVPCVMNTVVDGVGAYSTNDVLTPHPTKAGLWKVHGRVDDQIMHNNGEKTNPGPLEHILNQDPRVQTAIMFGRGRFNVGVIIEPKAEYAFDPSDEGKLVEFRKAVWPSVEKMNDYAPQHSRLFQEMIIVASPSKPFSYTAKHTPRRHVIIADYEDEIEQTYARVNESTQSDLSPPAQWTFDNTLEFVRAVVHKVLEHEIADADDLFIRGCDSLQATWIRNSLLHALRETSSVNTHAVPGNFVYNNPSVIALATFISDLANSDGQDDEAAKKRAIAAMLAMVDKYGAKFPAHVPSAPAPRHDVVLLTGTSGRLGACILASLVQTPQVARVYAVNRKSSTPIEGRQRAILTEQGYNAEEILNSNKVVFVDSNLDGEYLDLPLDLYEQIRTSVTHIMHNAWPVNFNMSLSSFEPSVKSVRALIDFALASPLPTPPRLLFVSSVGTLRNIDRSKPCKEGLIDATVAVGSGYSESKWVSEQILSRASKQTPLRTVAIRVGQLSGSSISGAWKSAEWLPALVRSSVYLKCLPVTAKQISWVSVDGAARALNEMRNSDVPNLHLGHPRPVPWSSVMEAAARTLSIPTVSYNEWFARLKASGEGLSADSEVEMMRQNPALKILDFFAAGVEEGGSETVLESLGLPALDMTEAVRAAPSLAPESLPLLSGEDACKWIGYWKEVGFLPSSL